MGELLEAEVFERDYALVERCEGSHAVRVARGTDNLSNFAGVSLLAMCCHFSCEWQCFAHGRAERGNQRTSSILPR
jgi:hypothetical protein